jgi:thioester reductase-like protein
VLFVTGFPGFLGSELLPRLLRRDAAATAVCLVQDRFHALAAERADALVAADPSLDGRIRLVVGDITAPDLGLGAERDALAASVTEVYHLAAVYDLSVPRDLALRVNVDGTRHVCDFAAAAPALRRLHYVSTCYVSGRYAGIFREDDLVKDEQPFNNHYEETKHLAEMVVRERMAGGLPATIYRPSVVAGDSRTGETQKLDGIYFVIRWILRQPGPVAVVPTLGDPASVRFNVIPRDVVVDALAELSWRDDTVGQCYALADPEPLTITQLLTEIEAAAHRHLVRLWLPTAVAKAALDYVPGVEAVVGIPSDAADYFTHPTHYDTRHTSEALAGTGLLAWDRSAWIRALVAFTADHLALSSDAMV